VSGCAAGACAANPRLNSIYINSIIGSAVSI
jgi:hypothetical protein